jgi:hypothetical protein
MIGAGWTRGKSAALMNGEERLAPPKGLPPLVLQEMQSSELVAAE